MAWHFTRPDGMWPEGFYHSGNVDIWIQNLECVYRSDDAPEASTRPVPVWDGQRFWGRMTFEYKNLGPYDEWVTVGFYCNIEGTRQYVSYPLLLDRRSYWLGVTVETYKTIVNTHGLADGRRIDTVKEAYYGYQYLPYVTYKSFFIGSDGDTDVYVVKAPSYSFEIRQPSVYAA